jgi:MoxR-like ATPase
MHMDTQVDLLEFLQNEHISGKVIEGIRCYRKTFPTAAEARSRIPVPRYLYYGREIWEQAATALLCGENLLLTGAKATGKNVLAENLAAVFQRPSWNVSFHINMDASFMIGTDTFKDGAVAFRPGPVYQCARHGGFGILDEINMARNEALAVLHAMLDHRRMIDVPGYDVMPLQPATRFIATMNYGYAGTRELNEALTSRFAVLRLPVIADENLTKLLLREFPSLRKDATQQFCSLFDDLQKKCAAAEISSKAIDLRGLLDAIRLMQHGLSPLAALDMGICNKTFDDYEPVLIHDLIAMRLSPDLPYGKIFTD